MQWLIISIIDEELDTVYSCTTWMGALVVAIELIMSQVEDATASEIRQELEENHSFYSDGGFMKVYITSAR